MHVYLVYYDNNGGHHNAEDYFERSAVFRTLTGALAYAEELTKATGEDMDLEDEIIEWQDVPDPLPGRSKVGYWADFYLEILCVDLPGITSGTDEVFLYNASSADTSSLVHQARLFLSAETALEAAQAEIDTRHGEITERLSKRSETDYTFQVLATPWLKELWSCYEDFPPEMNRDAALHIVRRVKLSPDLSSDVWANDEEMKP